MIYFGRGNNPIKPRFLLINLDNAASKNEIVNRLGSVLKGGESPLIGVKHGSLDALTDNISDWVFENIEENGNIFCVKIEGLNNLKEQDSTLLGKITSVIFQSVINGAHEYCRTNNITDPDRIFGIINRSFIFDL